MLALGENRLLLELIFFFFLRVRSVRAVSTFGQFAVFLVRPL